jgi:hypothetical protein
MTCLKFLAQCPCPRCLLLKSKIPRLGSARDTLDRVKLIRLDTAERRWDIEHVRKLIYQNGLGVGSKGIKRILGPKSMTPTRVCTACISMLYRIH